MAHRGRKSADDALVATLAGGVTVQAAAQRCGVSERTIFRRLQDSGFKQRIANARAGMLERALGQLSTGAAEAAVVLRKLLRSKADSIRLQAARTILELGNRLRENVEQEHRLRALEERLLAERAAS